LKLDETTTDGGVEKVATTMMTKTYFEDLGRIAESNAKSAQQSAQIATEYWVASRERNNKVAQEIAHTITEGMRRQTDANEELTTKIFEILEERDEAHKHFFEQWAQAFASVPFDYARQATRQAQRGFNDVTASVNGGFPISGYDELSVEEITERLEGLSEAQIKQVRDHERRTKNRKSLMEQFDRKLKAVS
jgi:bZIP Maf transcription factor